MVLTASYILYKRRKKILGKQENENGQRVVMTAMMFVSYRKDNNEVICDSINTFNHDNNNGVNCNRIHSP